jgi:hypothetical protein
MAMEEENTENEEIEENEFSEDFESLINTPPNWFLRSGLGIFLFVLVIFFVGSAIFKYPEFIQGEIKISSENERKKIVTKQAGKIHVFVKNGEEINYSGVIAIIDNPANLEEMLLLYSLVDSISKNKSLFKSDLSKFNRDYNIGELQPYYSEFLKAIVNFKHSREKHIYTIEKEGFLSTLKNYKELYKAKTNEIRLLDERLRLEKLRYDRKEALFKESVIPRADIEDAKITYLSIERDYELENANRLELEHNIIETENKIKELSSKNTIETEEVESELYNSFFNFSSKIMEWKQEYVLTAPDTGIVVYNNYLSEGQFVSANAEIASLIPKKESVFGIGFLKADGFGKVSAGQKVIIELDSYNYEEFGVLYGYVSRLLPIPQENIYQIYINFPEGLKTSLNYNVPYSPELHGVIKVITENKSLLSRIFNKVRTIVIEQKVYR